MLAANDNDWSFIILMLLIFGFWYLVYRTIIGIIREWKKK